MTFLENWWVIVAPLLFFLGWFAARLDGRQLLKENDSLPRSYFRGLNFLLNEQPDQAIDAFIEVARLDPETIELHFALGSLFRRRGETGRAIRVHQNLANRPDLSARERDHALFELGQNFLKAGMLDRAQSTLIQLPEGEFSTPARLCLLQLYELEKDWLQAINIAILLESEQKGQFNNRIAQFYCELAQEALEAKQFENVDNYLDHALLNNPDCVRALLLRGDKCVKSADDRAALIIWDTVPKLYRPLVVDRVLAAYGRLGESKEGLNWLHKHISNITEVEPDLLDAAFKYTLLINGSADAEKIAQQVLQAHPSLVALTRLAQVRLEKNKEQGKEPNSEQSLAYRLLEKQSSEMARYQCSSCGFRVRSFYWQCPGCAEWETFPAVKALEG